MRAFPDYKGGIINLGRALRGERVPDPFALEEPFAVFILDGVGYYAFRRFFGNVECVLPVSSVFPSTTAVAIPAMLSGRLPGEIGVYGTFVKEGEGVVNVLQKGLGMRVNFDATLYNPVYLAGKRGLVVAEKMGYYGSREDLALLLSKLSRRPENIVVYVPETDTVAHFRGPYAPATGKTIEAYLCIVARVAERWRRVIVISDHGMVRTGRQVFLARRGTREGDVFGEFRAVLTDRDDILPVERLTPGLCERLYGTDRCPAKYISLPRVGITYYFPGMESAAEKTRGGMHGGISPGEMTGILISGAGRDVAAVLKKALKNSAVKHIRVGG